MKKESTNKNKSIITTGTVMTAAILIIICTVMIRRHRSTGVPSSNPNIDGIADDDSNTINNNSPVASPVSKVTDIDLTPDPDGWVTVDRSKIVASDAGASAYIFHDVEQFDRGIASDDFHITGTVSYADRWFQSFESYIPKFGREIDDLSGSEKIKNYYALTKHPAEQERMSSYLASFAEDGKLWDQEIDYHHYSYSTYTAKRHGDYLSVIYTNEEFAGGAHPSHLITTENFAADGTKLTLADIFTSPASYQSLVGKAISDWQRDNNIDAEIFGTGQFTGSFDDEMQFYLNDTGVTLIFNEYDIAPYAAGPVELTIPYSELKIK